MSFHALDVRSFPPTNRDVEPAVVQPRRSHGWLATFGALGLAIGASVLVHRSFSERATDAVPPATEARPIVFTETARDARTVLEDIGGSSKGSAVVSRSAIVYVDGRPSVFVEVSDAHFVLTPVELGVAEGVDQHVSGLKAHDVVVTEGAQALRTELR